MKVRISGKADADLREIYKYSYRQFGERQADEYDSGLWSCFQSIANNPYAGRERVEISPPARSRHHRKHIVFYDIADDHILILRVLHERMDIENHLSRE